VSAVSLSDRESLGRFLDFFPPSCRQRVEELVADPVGFPTLIEVAAPVPKFKRHARACLAALGRELRRVKSRRRPPARVAWLVLNEQGEGLDAVEVEAALGAQVSIELLEQEGQATAASRTIAIGRLREDVVGLWASVPKHADPAAAALSRALDALRDGGMPIAAIAIDLTTAEAWSASPRAPGPEALRRLLATGSTRLALRCSASRIGGVLEDPGAALLPLQRLGAGAAVRWIALDDVGSQPPHGWLEALARHGIAADASLQWSVTPGAQAALTSATTYIPQAFDLRSPAARPSAPPFVETVRIPIASVAPSLVQRLTGTAPARSRPEWSGSWDGRLPNLLDYARNRRYREDMPGSVALAQRYAEFQVYNWPRSDPARRATLIDLGQLERPRDVSSALRRLRGGLPADGPWVRIVAGAEFLEAARTDALERVKDTARDVLDEQHAAHTYLSAVDLDAPLRADVQRFAAALPERLGRTLEIGSGRGQLARRLRSRSRLYVCCDASTTLLRDGPRPGACADIHALPFASARFDTIVANNVLEHAYDPLVCLRELGRVLAKSGALHAFIPLDGLEARHEIRTHLWKADTLSIELAVRAAGLRLLDLEVVDIYALGVAGAFPTCQGKVGRFVAARAETKGAA
jgi:SAM-dependent methyltransferase